VSQAPSPPSEQTPSSAASQAETARTVGRGFLLILTAKFWFLISGFAVQFGLPRLFLRGARLLVAAGKAGALSAERVAEGLYGDYGVAVRTVSWINNSMVQGTIQAVSKHVAEDESQATAVRAAGLQVQVAIGGGLALLYFLGADLMAGWLQDARLAGPFRVTAIIILAYALYAVFIGYLNGLKRFRAQASFDITYSTLKTGAILGLAFLGYGLQEVLAGFAGAAVAICLLAAGVVGVRRSGGARFPVKTLLRSTLMVVVYYVFFNFLLTADLLVLKALAGRVPAATPELAAGLASALTGIYNGVLNLALLPYQGVLAVAFVAFPLISRSTFDGDRESTAAYIRATLRYSLIFVCFVAVGVAAVPAAALGVLNASFAVGAPALRVYVGGEVFFALFAIANTIIIASGRMGVAAVLAAAVLALDLGANLLIVPHYLQAGAAGLDPVGLLAAASATAPVFLLGFLASSAYLAVRFGSGLPWLSAARVLGAAALAVAAAAALPRQGLVLSAAIAGGAVLLYFALLVLSRELGAADLERLRKVVRR